MRDAGGWSDQSLTEDIDLTLRMRMRATWMIVHETGMIVHELPPKNLGHLLRQRTRWARGWSQNTDLYLRDVWRRRGEIGIGATLAYSCQLIAAVSAPWSSIIPLLTLLRYSGLTPLLPTPIAIGLALIIIPTRPLAFLTAAWMDDADPIPSGFEALVECIHAALFWIVIGWLVQFHALYLELS